MMLTNDVNEGVKEVKVTWELRSPGQPNRIQGARWKHWRVFHVCISVDSLPTVLCSPSVSTVQDRPGSRCEEDWEAPWKTDETYGVQGEPQRCHGDRLNGSIRYSGFFHSSHITKCAYLFLTDLFVLPDFSCFLFAVNSRWTTCTVAFWSWWCGHGMGCFVKCQEKWQSWVCRNVAAAADGRIRCAFSSVGIITRDPYSLCCYNVFRTVLLLIAVFT